MPERLKDNGGEKLTEKVADDGPWGEEYQETVPPFSGGKKQSTNSPETSNNRAESDDYYVLEGVKYRNINKIDISTDPGKYEWLDALLENGVDRYEHELEEAKRKWDDETAEEAETQLDFIKRQQKILLNNIHIDGQDGTIGALQREYIRASKNFAEITSRDGKATQEAVAIAYENRRAASELLSLMEGEITRRKSNHVEENEEERATPQIDAVAAMDQLDANLETYEKNLEVAEQEKQHRIEWEKTHYGYVEDGGRPPISVSAAEEDIERIRVKISQTEKDSDLLYKIYKANGKSQMLSKADARTIINEMVQERDVKMAKIDDEIANVEKKSERWKQLKRERGKVYQAMSNEAIERVMALFD